jgi:hypothetical protein
VKKPTNKYCSRECCTIDPERHERMRQAVRRRILPMSYQLQLDVWGAEESILSAGCEVLEEAPLGLSRLAVG